jgi:hypothetical protein
MRHLTFASLVSVMAVVGCYKPVLESPGYYCNPDDVPACPAGQECRTGPGGYRCFNTGGGGGGGDGGGGGGGTIPKTGAPYTGTKNDPGLAMLSQCPDNTPQLEPNDTGTAAVDLTNGSLKPTPDTSPGKLTMLSICPKGNRPDTGKHDVDYFKVDTSALSSSQLTLMAEIFYDISYGDLDVAIFDEDGNLKSADGSAITNGCTAASLAPGVYYVVVAGAGNTDVNRYDMRVRTFSMSRSCAMSTPMDMSL